MLKLVERIENVMKGIGDVHPSQAMQSLMDLAGGIADDVGEELMDNYPELRTTYGAKATSIYQQYIFEFESVARKRLMELECQSCSSFKEATSFFGQAAYGRADEMFRNVNFQNINRFVVVGCGQLPFTAFHAHDHTVQTEIVALDVLDEAVESVTQLAQRFDMTRLHAEKQDGKFFDFSSADVVYIANMVSPKSEVLKRIATTGPSRVQVVMRDAYSIGRLWSERGRDALLPHFAATGCGTGASYKSQDVYLQRVP